MHRKRLGFVLIIAIFGVITILGATVAGLSRTIMDMQSTNFVVAETQALHLAEAALDQAIINLHTESTADDILSRSCATGSFQILDVTNIGSNAQRIHVRGTSRNAEADLEAALQLTRESIFPFALFGDHQVNVSGSAITDSYNSSLGIYNSPLLDQNGNPILDANGMPILNNDHNGDVGTNSTSLGGITVGGSISIDGQLAVGTGASDPILVVTGYNPAFITGGTDPPSDTQDVISMDEPFPMPTVTVPPSLTCSDFTVGGNSVYSLFPGSYCYHNLTIQGGGQLTSSGQVTIYLTGELQAQGNSMVGVPNDPTQITFLMSHTAGVTIDESKITGSNIFYASIYGPDATIRITGDAEIFGAIVAGNVDLLGSAIIHFDEALASCDGSSPISPRCAISTNFRTRLLSWRSL